MTKKTTLQVAGQDIEVRIVPDLEEYGHYDHDKRIICLAERLLDDDREFFLTLRHELIHASLSISGVAFGLTESTEEQVVRCLDGVFFPAYDNMIEQGIKWGRNEARSRSRSKADRPQPKRGRKA